MKQFLTNCLLVLFITVSFADTTNDADSYFIAPVDIPILLAGTFGELRGNHFHSGIDIKTEGRIGLNVLAIADGYVSRIKVSPYGFGKALYINHPNGTTSVYAHLQNYNTEIEAYIKKLQYLNKSFAIDKYLEPSEIVVKQRDVVATSGNTGGSSAPHLHFEIRDQNSQEPMNPLNYGIKIKDEIPPMLKSLWVYKKTPLWSKIKPKELAISKQNISYLLEEDTIYLNTSEIGFALETYDKANGANNTNGIYSAVMKVEGETQYQFEMDRFAFYETRYINAHIDYKAKTDNKGRPQRFFKLEGNRLSVYDSIINDGFVLLEEGEVKKIDFIVYDKNGNSSELSFFVKYSINAPPFELNNHTANAMLSHETENNFESENLKITFPKGCFYNDVFFDYKLCPHDPKTQASEVHQVHYNFEPVHRYFDLAIRPVCLPDGFENKALVVYEDNDNKSGITGNWKDGYLNVKTRNLGIYYIAVDTVPPMIFPVSIKAGKDLSNKAKFKVKIIDDLAGIDTYNGYIDGKWILMEYDAKNDMLIYNFEAWLKPGKHEFVLKVTDELKNESIYKAKFLR